MKIAGKPKLYGINSYFLIALFAGIILYGYGNANYPETETSDDELDLYEALLLSTHVVAVSISFIIAKQFWGTGEKVFQKAYTALAIGMLGNLIGWTLWFYFEIYDPSVEGNPYPYWNDLAFLVWHAGALTHLRLTTHRFQPKLHPKQLFVLFIIPSVITGFYVIFYSGETFVMDEQGRLQFDPYGIKIEFYEECNQLCFVASIVFIFLNPLMFSYALIGFSVFKKSTLGPAWLLLILGLGLTVFADIPYYYSELFGGYEREHWYTMFYFASPTIMAYALYKHRDLRKAKPETKPPE